MSSIPMYVPTLEINENDLQNLVHFIYKHEQLLKEFGAIKIQPNIDCKLSLKKRKKNVKLCPINENIVKMNKDELIYSVKKVDHINDSIEQNSLVRDEFSFWSSLSCSSNDQQQLNISI